LPMHAQCLHFLFRDVFVAVKAIFDEVLPTSHTLHSNVKERQMTEAQIKNIRH